MTAIHKIRFFKRHRDVFISGFAAILALALLYLFVLVVGFKAVFIIPVIDIFYKTFTVLLIAFAVIIIIANKKKNKYIISNYSLIGIYLLSILIFSAFIITAAIHFHLSVDRIYEFLKYNYKFPTISKTLFYFIFFSQIAVLIFFLATLMSRTKGIGHQIIKKIHYENYYSNILDYIYGDKQTKELAVEKMNNYLTNDFIIRNFINTLNMFNFNFKGELKQRTHDLFFEMKLNLFVRKRLKSLLKSRTIWAIKTLSSFKDLDATEELKEKLLHSRNRYIQFETLLGLIRLNEADYVLRYLAESKEYLVGFDAIKITTAIRLQNKAVKDYGFLLQSGNDGVVILGLNLINEYHEVEHIPSVKELLLHPNLKVVRAAMNTLMNLDYVDYEKYIVEAITRAPIQNKMELLFSIQPYFSEDSLLWAREMMINEKEKELKVLILHMMQTIISKQEVIVGMFDEPQKEEIKALFNEEQKGIPR